MKQATFKKIKILITTLIMVLVAISIINESFFLAFFGVAIGLLFLLLVRRKSEGVLVDERIEQIGGKAARVTFVIMTIFSVIMSIMFLLLSRQVGDPYAEALGAVFGYFSMLSLAVYSATYKYIESKYSANDDK